MKILQWLTSAIRRECRVMKDFYVAQAERIDERAYRRERPIESDVPEVMAA
jgi:hypothetical protein